MKTITILLTLILSHLAMAEDMQNYLSKTEELAQEGEHKEALERYIWFHDHALEHQPSMYGVRLSFALSSWKRLADKYPPAMKAFKEIRDQKTKKLSGGNGNRAIFHDVVALNRTLGDETKTITLFESIAKKDQQMANDCWGIAKAAVFKEKRYDLAQQYVKSVSKEFDRVERSYERKIKMYANPDMGGERFKAYNENNLVKEVLQLIEVSLAIGKRDDALAIQKRALALVKDDRLIEAIPAKGSAK